LLLKYIDRKIENVHAQMYILAKGVIKITTVSKKEVFRRRLAFIANLYYKEKLSQQEIAQQIGISRPQVSRLLTQAEEAGIVH
jgi:DNA-directed RNA polymerase specialized sigma subunit